MKNSEYSSESYVVEFENNSYVLCKSQVDELLIVSKYCYHDLPVGYMPINLIITLKNKQKLSGHIISYEGFNPLSPYDVFIPLKFTLKQSKNERILTFLEIENIKIE